MPFKNRIRLPFYVTRPQYPTERNVFRRADGSSKTLSAIVRKTFEGETENLPKEIHERLIIALNHDDITIEGYRYLGGVSLDADYDIDWQKFLDYPLAKAQFKVQVTPFDYSNDNCKTCEEISQVVCNDDNIGTLAEDETATVHVLDNDEICCKPVAISLVTYNTDYLDSCVISGNDIIIHTKASLTDANNVVLVTYRAQCPSGSYDDANIIGNINGTDPTPVCLAPTNIINTALTDTTADFSWSAPSPAPGCGYHWEVRHNILLISSGDVVGTSVQVTGLTASTSYSFSVRSNCCSLNSNYGVVLFFTNPPQNTQTCGQYEIYNADFPGNYAIVSYIDCNGVEQTNYVQGTNSIIVCALQTEPESPVEMMVSGGSATITYLGLC